MASKPSDILRHHHNQICNVLATAEETMTSFVIMLHGKHVITISTKNDVCQTKGLDGPNTLLDILETKVDESPEHLDTILEIMKELEDLHDTLESIQKESYDDKQEMSQPHISDVSISDDIILVNPVSEAQTLLQEFLDLLDDVYDSLENVDACKLKLHINWFLSFDRRNKTAIQEHSDNLQLVPTSKGVLNFLISKHYLGYLNYELLKIFSRVMKSKAIDSKIQLYEKHHDRFLSEISFRGFIEVFTQHPDLAPSSPVGLPTLKIHLNSPWEDNNVYKWNELIEQRFNWSPYLTIASISRNCIVLIYGVLPFFIPHVARDLTKDEVIMELKSEGITLEPSSELLKLGKEECFFQLEDIQSKNSSAHAMFLLKQHLDTLYDDIHNPTSIAEKLCIEGVFDEQCYNKDSTNISSMKQVFFHTLREAVSLSHYNLKVFASVLYKYKSTVHIAQELLKKYNEHICEPSVSQSISDGKEEGKYQLTIHSKSKELDGLFHDVRATLEAKSIFVYQIVSYLISFFPNLENELECCKSLQEVFNVIRTYTSLDNVSYIETITDKYELSKFDDILQQYHTSVDEMCEEILVNELFEQTFMHHFTRHLLKEESMTLVIELKENEKYTLLQIMDLLNSFFHKMTKLMKLTGNKDSVHALCYAPFHLFNMFVRTVTDNTAGLIHANILTISIGGFCIFQRDLEIEKEDKLSEANSDATENYEDSDLHSRIQMQQKLIKGMEKELENDQLRARKIQTFSSVLETTKLSLDQELLELQKLQDESHHLTSLLKGKENELSQLKEEKRQLQWKDDVYVVDEIILTATGDKECTLQWPEYGLQIDFSKGSLPSGRPVELQIKAIVAGDFKLPPNCHLVSSIYWINCPEQFDKKVTLHLPHAAVIESEEEASYFRFYAAKCSSGPPYEFKELKNGSFIPYRDSASITLSQFSHIAVGTSELPSRLTRQRYYSQVLYKLMQPHEWDMIFVVMKDDPAFKKFIKEEYSDYLDGAHQIIKLQEDASYIRLQPDSRCLDQWEMSEIISSQIDREDIDYFTPEQTLDVPHCHFNFYWQSDLPVKKLNMRILLEGANGPNNFFRVMLPQRVSPGGTRHSPHDIVKSHLPTLVRATTDPDRLANDLFSANLISDSVRNRVLTTSSLSQYDKSSILLEEFLRYLSIFNDRQTLASFCHVLNTQDDPVLSRLSEELSRH